MPGHRHPLLSRQLQRVGIDAAALDSLPAAWQALLDRVSKTYEDHDQESYLLERSQDLASREMGDLNAQLRQERDSLDQRVRDRTEALHLSEDRLQSLLKLSADWIWEQDDQLRFSFVSSGIEAATGLPPDVLLGQNMLNGQVTRADTADRAAYQACLDERRPFRDFRFLLRQGPGGDRHIRLSGEPVYDPQGRFTGYRGVGRDVTEATLAQQRVHELASVDMLTGLPNRSMFLAELDRAMARARRGSESFAVAFIDLDRFKTINDTLGHGAGDELLRTMGRRLRMTLRAHDMVARFGGDEFVVLLSGSIDNIALETVGHKLLAAIGRPLKLQGCRLLVTGSIGISRYPVDAEDAQALLQQADAAMYLAKERGKNNVQFYTAELAQRAARDFALEGELRLALQRDELRLHYQPKIDLASGRLVGSEALLRWEHPKRGLVPPGEFIPLAEERGLIVALGRWVTAAACQQIQRWRDEGLQVPPVAVNLSARQFSSESLVPDLLEAMSRHDVRAGELEVELTESVLMSEPERANAVLRQIKHLGVSVAIDDFGTGYSSLSYLKRFPASTVKIDRSFVRGLPDDRDDVTITQAVIALAHSLQLRVVAEGVETPEQLALLRTMGCDEAQGFLLGRPMTAEAFGALIGTAGRDGQATAAATPAAGRQRKARAR